MERRWNQADARDTPVTDGCVWCKGTAPAAERTPVGDDEHVCANCLGDLREWKRYRFVEFYVSAGLEPAARRVTLDHYQAIQAELAAIYDDHADLFPLPAVKSNADGRDTQAPLDP